MKGGWPEDPQDTQTHTPSRVWETFFLFKSQYGFHEIHSKQYAIIDIVNVIKNNMDQKLFTCGIFLDLKKGLWYHRPFNLASKT